MFNVPNMLLIIVFFIMTSSKISAMQFQLFFRDFKVTSFNIQHAKGNDGQIDIARIIRVLSRQRASVICLQEVDFKTKRSGGVDQAKIIAFFLGMSSKFVPSISYDGGKYGNAILYDPALEGLFESIDIPSDKEKRKAIFFSTFVDGVPLVIINTHFALEENKHMESIYIIVRRTSEQYRGFFPILMGDFNSDRASNLAKYLDYLFVINPNISRFWTFPSHAPIKQIDFIALGRSPFIGNYRFDVDNDTLASDHRAISATFSWYFMKFVVCQPFYNWNNLTIQQQEPSFSNLSALSALPINNKPTNKEIWRQHSAFF